MEGSTKKTMFSPSQAVQAVAHVASLDQYKEMYNDSITHPEKFWRNVASSFFFKQKHDGKAFFVFVLFSTCISEWFWSRFFFGHRQKCF